MIRAIHKHLWTLLLAALILTPTTAFSQPNVSAPRIFGYFQTSFHHFNQPGDDENSFNLQQRYNPLWMAAP